MRESPVVAALSALLFGPLGFFYLGWRYGVLVSLVVLPWFALLVIVNPSVAELIILLNLPVLANEARLVARRLGALPVKDKREYVSRPFLLPLLATSSITLGMATTNVGLIALLFSLTLFFQHRTAAAVAMLVAGVPVMIAVTLLLLAKAAESVEFLVATAAPNPFRRGWRLGVDHFRRRSIEK